MAEKIVLNAKIQRPAVCNSVETVLIDRAIAENFLPKLVGSLVKQGVKLYGCQETLKICGKDIFVAKQENWSTE